MSQGFQFECPLTVFKAEGAPEGKQRRIAGIISTDSVDKQNEQILQDGLSFDSFLSDGWLNDNHKSGVTDVLGFPESVRRFSAGDTLPDGQKAPANCTWVEGYLLDTPKANDIWELATALAKTHRRLGYSVEGEIEDRTGPEDRTIAKAKVRNVAITHCFPGEVRVLADVKGVSRRHYDGVMIDLELASGHRVSGTPNHPVLTQRGWVGLGEINESSDQVGRMRGDFLTHGPGPLSADDIQNVPPTLEEVFGAFDVLSPVDGLRAGNKHDFHGDGTNRDINVVAATGLLMDRMQAAFNQHLGKGSLSVCKADQLALAAKRGIADAGGLVNTAPQAFASQFRTPLPGFFGAARKHLAHCGRLIKRYAKLIGDMPNRLLANAVPSRQLATASASGVGLGNFSVQLPRELLKSAPRDPGFFANVFDLVFAQAERLGHLPLFAAADVKPDRLLAHLIGDRGKFTDAAALDATLFDLVGDLADGQASSLSDASEAFARGVVFESVSQLRRREFSGHVYNLEAQPGWYVADGLVVKNCPVNAESRLEVLARSLTAQNTILRRAMTITDSAGSAGPVKPNRPYTGQGAGQVLTPEHLQGVKPKRKKGRTMSRKQAAAYVKSVVPGLPEVLVRAIIHRTLHPQGRE